MSVFDDKVQEKEWTDENEVMCWHYDYSKGRTVKGINLLNALSHNGEVSIPVAFEAIRKPILFCDVTTRQVKRARVVTKNELMREMLNTCMMNAIKFRDVLIPYRHKWIAGLPNQVCSDLTCDGE